MRHLGTPRSKLVGLAAVGLAVMTAGCGSTVQGASQLGNPAAASGGLALPSAAGSSQGGSGLGIGDSTTVGNDSGGTSADGSGAPGSGATRSGAAGRGAAGPSTSGPRVGGAAAGSHGSDGPGVTATTINVAGAYDPNAGAEDAALGLANANPGDEQAEEQAVVNYVNAHGGLAGRKVNMIWYKSRSDESSTQTQQGECATWTQDRKAFILSGGSPLLDQCTAKAGGVGLWEAIVGEDTALQHEYPTDVDLTGFSIDRGMAVTIAGLKKEGYFGQGAKVGIATWADPTYEYGIAHGAQPALSAAGVGKVPVEYISVPQSYQDLGATSSAVSSAVLKFHSEGINHVILFDGPAGVNSSGILCIEWMQQASSQHYYPKYGLNSTSGFSTGASDYPEKEMIGSEGVGWWPSWDLNSADYAALPQSKSQKLCLAIEKKAKQPISNANQQSVAFGTCDFFFFLQQAFRDIHGPLNATTAMAAINAMGTSYKPDGAFGLDITSSQHSAAALVRNVAFVPSCTCYRYTSSSYAPG